MRGFAPLLAGIVALAAVLRCASLGFGLDVTARPDEPGVIETLGILRDQPLTFRPLVVFYGGGYVLPLLAFTSTWHALAGPGPSAGLLDWDPDGLLVAARAFSALAGVATVAFVGLAARHAAGPLAGFLAAAVMAVAPLAVREAHFAKADTAAACAAAFLLWALCQPWARDARRAVGIAAAAACALGTKAGATLVPVAGLALLGGPPRAAMRRLAIATAAFLAVALPLHLVWLLHPVESWTWVRALIDVATGPAVPEAPPPLRHYAVVALRHGCGLTTALLALPAIVRGLWRGGALRLVALATLALWAALATGRIALVRYFLPSVPGIAVLVGALAAALVDRIRRAGVPWTVAASAVALALVAAPLAQSATLVRLLGRTDTRTLAGAWIRAHLPPDAVIASYGGRGAIADYGRPNVGARRVYAALPVARWDEVGVTHVVAHRYPLPWSSEPVPAGGHERLVPLQRFDPFDGPLDAPVLEALDAFYLPLDGFAGIARPGPHLDVYAVRRP